MSRPRRIITFVLLAAGTYLLLVILWSVLSGPYRAAFAAAGNAIFGKFGEHGRVVFEPMADPSPVLDTTFRLSNTREGIRKNLALSVRYHAYLPLAVLVSLVVATPLPWSRRAGALALGLLLVVAFVVLRFWLRILEVFGEDPAPLYHRGPFWQGALAFLVHLTYLLPLSSVVAPVVVWVLVTFRRGDWQRLTAPGAPAQGSTRR